MAIPRTRSLIAAGPIVAALVGVGVGGAVGGFTGVLIGMGIPEYEGKRYEGRIKEGGILLSVHCDSSEWATRAKDILKRTGGQDIASTGEARADFMKTDKPLRRAGRCTFAAGRRVRGLAGFVFDTQCPWLPDTRHHP